MKIPYGKHELPGFTADQIFGRNRYEGRGLEKELDEDYHEVVENNPRGAGDYSTSALSEAVKCHYVGAAALMKRCFSVAMDGAVAGSRAYVAGLGVDVDFAFDGKSYRGAAKRYGFATKPTDFVWVFSMAIALRHRDAQLALSAITSDIERASGGMDDAYFLFSEAYRHFWRGDADARGLLEDAAVSFRPENLSIADPRSAARYSSCIPAMYALLDNDEAAFNQALFAGVNAHKTWWGRGKRLSDPDGLWAPLPLALAAIAYDRGMKVEVESDYIPRWLIEGKDPE